LTPAAKSRAANWGFALGISGFLLGSILLCDCPGLFVCAGVAAALPAILGTRVLRIAGICLCIASFAFAVMQFRHERERELRIQRFRERAPQSQSQQ
jgi:hypothetical protein